MEHETQEDFSVKTVARYRRNVKAAGHGNSVSGTLWSHVGKLG